MSFGMILLNENFSVFEDLGIQKVAPIIGLALVVLDFGYILSVFRMKYQGYPYRLGHCCNFQPSFHLFFLCPLAVSYSDKLQCHYSTFGNGRQKLVGVALRKSLLTLTLIKAHVCINHLVVGDN